MVASSQVLASRVGLGVLREGGTAADACVAMDGVLNVAEPMSTSLGGDMFALYYEAGTGRIAALNGSGRSPGALNVELLRHQGYSAVPDRHGHAVTVPGACAGWFDLIERYGSMPMAQLLAPAIRLADEGFPVAPVTAAMWARNLDRLQSPELTIDGRAPVAGETFRNPGLARALRRIAVEGRSAFYSGDIAAATVEAVRESGGAMSLEDLLAHTSTWEEPISTSYRDTVVWECPPNGQGLAALLALNIMEGYPPADALSVDRWHHQIEAMRLAFADTRWYVTDPRCTYVPVAELLSREYAAQRRTLIRPDRATADVKRGSPVAHSDTVYLCAVDGHGNACSFISSNFVAFGTGIVPAGWGFTLQNRGCSFVMEQDHPNVLARGKRPYHTIIPGMLTHADGTLWGPFGVMGGAMQPQGHLQVVTALVDDREHPQAALNRARFCLESGPTDRVLLEEGVDDKVIEGLRSRGHEIVANVPSFGRSLFGRGQIILRDANGTLQGGSDPRGDGCIAGF